MRMTAKSILILLMISGCAPERPEPLCVLAPDMMPEGWRPSDVVQRSLSAEPWSVNETKDAEYAAITGFDELKEFFSNRPTAVADLGIDAVESVIESSYSTSNMPALQMEARQLARQILTKLIAPYLGRDSGLATCKEFSTLIDLAIQADALLPQEDARIPTLVGLTNASYRSCGSIAMATGYDFHQRLAAENVSTDELSDLVLWSITFTDAQLVPGLELPSDARDLPPALWSFLGRYPLVAARAFPEGGRNTAFYDMAYLATHIAYIPSGYGRHPIYIADAPWLYRFLRENFYPVLEMGELDLVAEFVDLFRQYGCTEQSDLQLRDGTRYLLRLFHSAGDRWMTYREPNEPANTGDYNEIHKAWTGTSAVRVRVPEPPKPGTYGYVVRTWLGHPR
jgi:hypothetical protein